MAPDLEFPDIETNIVWIKVNPKKAKAPELIKSLKEKESSSQVVLII